MFSNFTRNNYPLITSLFFIICVFLIFPKILFFILCILDEHSNAILAIVAILGLLFGQSWLNTSKKKMKGKLEYDIARKYLRAVLKIRDAIKIVRNPFIPVGEILVALKKQGFKESDLNDNKKVNSSVYSLRWEKIQNAWTHFEEVLLDAEVSFGQEAIEVQKGLDELLRKLRSVIWLFINSRKSFDESDSENFKILYETYDDNDKFAKDIDKEIEKIRNFLKKHL